ncbi:hypothetical protein ES703_04846 [subsurface metagenome]
MEPPGQVQIESGIVDEYHPFGLPIKDIFAGPPHSPQEKGKPLEYLPESHQRHFLSLEKALHTQLLHMGTADTGKTARRFQPLDGCN